MNNDNQVTDFNTPYQKTLALCDEMSNLSIISEDERVTLKLASDCPTDADSPAYAFEQVSQHGWDEQVTAIELDNLSPEDQIIIETPHSLYSFTVVDPHFLYGRLIGGILGNRIYRAALKFSCSESESQIFTVQRLTLGVSIVFNIEGDNGFRQLITSAITRLHLRKGDLNGNRESVREKRISAFITRRLDEIEKPE